ncbi:hypothetical protein BJY17_003591 [Agromyces hippuratus]|uniref:DUF416 family protein n=2 Tax=Agromyces hippuratus TaxID=286438 RepID=A0A852X5N9_9MICO|nr:DUF416 family protein [Agromyces hippuratus]NYG22844.1 hypothetical protein [Agromyces hippuratus]
MARYEEAEIAARLTRLGRVERTAFAAACAERLWPLFTRCAEVAEHADATVVRGVLDDLWRAVNGADVSGIAQLQGVAEAMVPSDDDEWVFEMGYLQNAAASVAYAIRVWLTGSPQEAVWAARQVYEVADYAARRLHPDLDVNAPNAERELLRTAVVQGALSGLSDDLAAVESHTAGGWASVQHRARQGGAAWARSLP